MRISRNWAVLALQLLSNTTPVYSLTPAQWRSQSIYQVMTDRFSRTEGSTTAPCDVNNYCGGTWKGLINRLDYIQSMGFSAVWISPVVQNVQGLTADGSSYHGYWANDIYSLNSKYGTAADLLALSNALHQRGMYLMVDIVVNHMAYIGAPSSVQYQTLNPFNSASDYHQPPCFIDYNNATSIKKCWIGDSIVSLPDLRTEDARIANTWNSWITQLVSNYSIDGLRLDTVYQVNQDFWPPFQSAAGGIHAIGEVWNGDPNVMCPYQNYVSGLMNYPAYYWITQAFQSTSGSISNLVNGINQMKTTCKDVTLLGSFLENHDNPRFPSYTSDNSLAKNAVAFAMLADGIPIVYEGQEQSLSGKDVPANREPLWRTGYSKTSTMYTFIQTVNKLRAWAIKKDAGYVTTNAVPAYSDSRTIVMRKAAVVAVFTNRGAGGFLSTTVTLSNAVTGFAASQQVVDVLACKTYTTTSKGAISVSISKGLPQVLYAASALTGSGLCGK